MIVSVRDTDVLLSKHHYLGPCRRGTFAWRDDHGCMVFARPSARHVPKNWLELSRWCLVDGQGSRQWASFVKNHGREESTIISYSDPRQGHTGALYRACNWLWAPTWHRLRPPPTGNGAWAVGKSQGVKDRWVFPLCFDPEREWILRVNDAGLRRQLPWAEYKEPVWSRGRFKAHTGGGNYKAFVLL